MHNTYTLLDVDLRLFDGAAAGASAGGTAAGDGVAQATEGLPKADSKKGTGSSRRGKTGAFDNVVFGKQEDASAAVTQDPAAGGKAEGNGIQTTSDALEAKRKTFRDMIEGEYKDQFSEVFQSAFNRRFKDAKSMETSLNAQKPIMDILAQRYNIADGDPTKLLEAIEKDNVYWEDAADEAGLTVEQYKAMKKLERENAEFKAMRDRQIGEQQANAKLQQWYSEAERVKEMYPSFDFRAETGNRDFMGLLRNGISVQQAYELVHMEEIKAAAARNAAQTAGQQMAAKIKSKAERPQENGMSSQSAVITRNDVHSLTREERMEIARRAMQGKKIRF